MLISNIQICKYVNMYAANNISNLKECCSASHSSSGVTSQNVILWACPNVSECGAYFKSIIFKQF